MESVLKEILEGINDITKRLDNIDSEQIKTNDRLDSIEKEVKKNTISILSLENELNKEMIQIGK